MATAQEILSDSECTACSGAADIFQILEIGLLQQIATGLGVTMTQAEINAESECWTCYGLSQAEAAIVVLLNTIAVNLGGGGGGGAISANLSGAGSPVGVVTPTANNQFYRDTTGIALWQSTGLTNTSWTNWI
jgi:hypothetical protein